MAKSYNGQRDQLERGPESERSKRTSLRRRAEARGKGDRTFPKHSEGKRSWNTQNVTLWIGKNESLYRLAIDCKRRYPKSLGAASRAFSRTLGGDRTPDGATYNQTCIREALDGLE